jgi:hypothetical protein
VRNSTFGPRKKPLARSPFSRKGSPFSPDRQQFERNQEARKRIATKKEKTRGAHVLELQAAFNEWVRLRDATQPCISCGTYQGEWHAGHYRSVGSEPALRLEPDNCHRQCARCNVYMNGNLAAYRVNLIEKIGLERVEWLESSHEPKKYPIAEILEMKAFYRAEVRRLKREAA